MILKIIVSFYNIYVVINAVKYSRRLQEDFKGPTNQNVH